MAAHLALVWLLAAATMTVLFHAFSDSGPNLPICVAALALALLPAGLSGRRFAPLTRTVVGLLLWTAFVLVVGATVALLLILVVFGRADPHPVVVFVVAGAAYAFAAVLLVPDWVTRVVALTSAVVLMLVGTAVAREFEQDRLRHDRVHHNGVPDELELVGAAPPGYRLSSGDGGLDVFLASYQGTDTGLLLEVRSMPAGEASVERVCPAAPGRSLTCADDGDGRTFVRYPQLGGWWELWLRRGELVFMVSPPRTSDPQPIPDPAPARHILQTLHPASSAELEAMFG